MLLETETVIARCSLCGRVVECDIEEVSGEAFCLDSRDRPCH